MNPRTKAVLRFIGKALFIGIIVFITDILKERYFDDNFWIGLLICAVLALIFTVLGEICVSAVRQSKYLSRLFKDFLD